MVTVSSVAEGIYQISTDWKWKGTSTFNTKIYFIEDKEKALVEVGAAKATPAILEGIKKLNQEPASLSYIFLTHIHADHAGGVGNLIQSLPQAKVIVYEKGLPHLVDPSRLIQGTKQAFGEDFEDEFGPILPVPENRIQTVKGGENFTLGEHNIKVIYSPGHAPHHISFFEEKSQGLFCGEALGSYLPEVDLLLPAAAPPAFDLELALKTIENLKALNPRVLFYSHHGVGYEVEKLFKRAKESTKTFGEIILEGMKSGKDKEEIARELKEYIARLTPAKVELDLSMTIEGYMGYFKKRG